MVRASTALFLCGAALRPESRSLAEAAPQLPPVLTLKTARSLFRERGFDLMLAEANVVSAEGDFAAAGALPNPGVSLPASKNFGCMSSRDCNTKTYSIGLADNDLISNVVTGKRGLRKDFAGAALDAARRSRDDARRTLEFMLEQGFYQALVTAEQNLRAAKVALAFLLGFRDLVPDFGLDQKELDFALPGPVATATRESLLGEAKARRPDLAALTQQVRRAEAGLTLARRNIVPDVGVSVACSTSSDLSAMAQTGSIGISFNLPLLYFQRGEIRRAEADLVTQQVLRALETTTFRRVGGTRDLSADVRITGWTSSASRCPRCATDGRTSRRWRAGFWNASRSGWSSRCRRCRPSRCASSPPTIIPGTSASCATSLNAP
jgi:outer membrane protein TolC